MTARDFYYARSFVRLVFKNILATLRLFNSPAISTSFDVRPES